MSKKCEGKESLNYLTCMLPDITFTPIKYFAINIGNISYGWMDVTLYNKHKSYEYTVSYVCDPLDDLLRLLIRGITNNPKHELPIAGLINTVVHDLEGSLITWAFCFNNDDIHITIWENIDANYDQQFDKTSFEYNEFMDAVNISGQLQFALEGSIIDFAKPFKELLENVSANKPDVDDYNHWGYTYSADNFRLLSEYVNKHR